MYLVHLQISRPSNHNTKLYIAALLTLSSKDFLSYFFTVQSDDMVISSLNVRGLSNNRELKNHDDDFVDDDRK